MLPRLSAAPKGLLAAVRLAGLEPIGPRQSVTTAERARLVLLVSCKVALRESVHANRTHISLYREAGVPVLAVTGPTANEGWASGHVYDAIMTWPQDSHRAVALVTRLLESGMYRHEG